MKYEQFIVAKEHLQFVTKDIKNMIMGVSVSGACFYFTPKASIFPFAINKDESTRNLEPNEKKEGIKAFSAYSKEEKIEYLNWLSKKNATKEFSSDSAAKINDFVQIYFLGLEYRVIVDQRDFNEVLQEVILLFQNYVQFVGDNLRNDMVNLIIYLIFRSKNLDSKLVDNVLQIFKSYSATTPLIERNLSLLSMFISSKTKNIDITNLDNIVPSNSNIWKSCAHFNLATYVYKQQLSNVPDNQRMVNVNKVYNFSEYKKLGTPYPFFYNISASLSVPKISKEVNLIISSVCNELQKIQVKHFIDNIATPGLDEFISLPSQMRANMKNNPLKNFVNKPKKVIRVSELISVLGIPYKPKAKEVYSLESSIYLSRCMNIAGVCIEPDPYINFYEYVAEQYVAIYTPTSKKYGEKLNLREVGTDFLYVENLLFILANIYVHSKKDSISVNEFKSVLESIIDYPDFKLSSLDKERLSCVMDFVNFEADMPHYEQIGHALCKKYSQKDIVYIMHLTLLSYVLFTDNISVMPYCFYFELRKILGALNKELNEEQIEKLLTSLVERFKPLGIFPTDFSIERENKRTVVLSENKKNATSIKDRIKILFEHISKAQRSS